MVLAQLILLAFLTNETYTDEETIEQFATPTTNVHIVLARFVAAVFLHYILTEETKQGFAIMKFANNHWWKFDNWFAAYFVGLTQVLNVFLVETVNMVIIISNVTILDVIMNFLALVILTEFDNFFFKAVARTTVFGKALDSGVLTKEENDSDDLELVTLAELLKVQVTTAKQADFKTKGHRLV